MLQGQKHLLRAQSNVPGKVIRQTELLARLFDNLINNAIKYGADGKRVLVQIPAEEEVVTVSVTNYGYVIPADELPLLFNKFYRVEQSRSTNTAHRVRSAIAKKYRRYARRHDSGNERSEWNGVYGAPADEF